MKLTKVVENMMLGRFLGKFRATLITLDLFFHYFGGCRFYIKLIAR